MIDKPAWTKQQRQAATAAMTRCGGCGNILALYNHERGICDACHEANELALDMEWLRAARLKDQENDQ